jgi:hypothetical protein
MTNALKTNANMNAVISHSKMFATSVTLSFFVCADFSASAFLDFLSDINIYPDVKQPVMTK